jgi:hypothetical protein
MSSPDLETPSRPVWFGALATGLLVIALLIPAAATARTITVGPSMSAQYGSNVGFLFPSVRLAQTSLSDPEANVVSPVDGAVVRWRLSAQAAADAYSLRVLRPTGSGPYTGAGTSAPVVASTTSVLSFPTNLPIRAGDAIGVNLLKPVNPSIRAATGVGLSDPYWSPILADGATSAQTSAVNGLELGFNAEVQPAPRVVLVGPSSGLTAGGTSVTVAGSDFATVTGVKFGSVPAASFAVNSEAQITATAPAAAAGPVDVSVTTVAGTSPPAAGDQFTYTAPPSPPPPPPPTAAPPSCVVPKLVGKKLKGARKALAKANCKLGKVNGEKGKTAKIVRQAPKPGASRTAGSAVAVMLG